jgi:hypothetical protein
VGVHLHVVLLVVIWWLVAAEPLNQEPVTRYPVPGTQS